MKALQRISISPQNAILVVVDVENEFCKPGGKAYNEKAAPTFAKMFSGVRNLLGKARKAGIPVIYIQSVRTLEEAEFKVFNKPPRLQQGTWNVAICDEVQPQDGELVIPKFCHDPFFRPDLERALAKLVPEPTRCYAIVTGGMLNVCVYHTALGFYLRKYWTIVPVDSVYYDNAAAYEAAIEMLSERLAYPNIFLSSSDLISVSSDPALLEQRPVPGC